MNKYIKGSLGLIGALIVYRFYKLYELGESIIYKPVGLSFTRGKTLNDFVIRIKMELLNPTKTVLDIRGVDGVLSVADNILSTFITPPFKIKSGISYFFLNFKVKQENIGVEIVKAILSKKIPVFSVKYTQKLPYFSISSKFDVNPKLVDTKSNVLVK
jgi:hypothetical protein